MAMREVGKKYLVTKEIEFTYKDVQKDADGWADASCFLPFPYDLMHLKVKRDGEVKRGSIPGWWNGTVWDGLKLQEGDEVVYWKRKPEGL